MSFDKTAIDSCRPQLYRHNLSALKVISILSMVMLLLFSLFPLAVEQKPYKAIFYYVAAAIEGGVFLYARGMSNREKWSEASVFIGFLIYFATLMVYGIYIGVWQAPNGFAVNFMIFLVCGQIMFVFTPLKNLAINLATVGLFLIATFLAKPPANAYTDMMNAIVAMVCALVFNWYVSHVIVKGMLRSGRMEKERNYFREESETDELTNLSNRRYFFQSAHYSIEAWLNAQKNICMIMVDLDYFKNYNDHYGHPEGDIVLQRVGGVLKWYGQKEGVLCARVGGEEFALLFAENQLAEAEQLARDIKNEILRLEIEHAYSKVGPFLTVSLGLYFFQGGQTTADDMYRLADMALYRAKKCGRNCIVMLDSEQAEYRMLTES